MRPPRELSCPRRRPSFPKNRSCRGSSRPLRRISCGCGRSCYRHWSLCCPGGQVWGGGSDRGPCGGPVTWPGGQVILRGDPESGCVAKRNGVIRRRVSPIPRKPMPNSWRPREHPHVRPSPSPFHDSPQRGGRKEAGSLRRKSAKNNESGADVSNLRASISAIIAAGRRSPRSGWSRRA
jgi:hypothetical protein